jgi:hypothetical protein
VTLTGDLTSAVDIGEIGDIAATLTGDITSVVAICRRHRAVDICRRHRHRHLPSTRPSTSGRQHRVGAIGGRYRRHLR